MSPLIYDGYILAVDSSQTDHPELDGKIVIAWNKDMGLTVSRLQRYGQAEVLHPENREYESIVIDNKHGGKFSRRFSGGSEKPLSSSLISRPKTSGDNGPRLALTLKRLR